MLRQAAQSKGEDLAHCMSDTDADTDAEPAGSGPRGQGPGLRVGRGTHERGLQDGAGLCSLGRWEPADRPKQTDTRLICLGAAIRREVAALRDSTLGSKSCLTTEPRPAVEIIFDRLASGAAEHSIFPEERTRALLDYADELFGEEGGRR